MTVRTRFAPAPSGRKHIGAYRTGLFNWLFARVQDGEFVLMSVPSPDVSPAALALGRSVKQSIIVATDGVTHFGDARRTADLLRESGVDVLAGILVKS